MLWLPTVQPIVWQAGKATEGPCLGGIWTASSHPSSPVGCSVALRGIQDQCKVGPRGRLQGWKCPSGSDKCAPSMTPRHIRWCHSIRHRCEVLELASTLAMPMGSICGGLTAWHRLIARVQYSGAKRENAQPFLRGDTLLRASNAVDPTDGVVRLLRMTAVCDRIEPPSITSVRADRAGPVPERCVPLSANRVGWVEAEVVARGSPERIAARDKPPSFRRGRRQPKDHEHAEAGPS